MSLDRIRRVILRIKKFYSWCDEWSMEGAQLEKLAQLALEKGNKITAKCLFHEAAGCFHIGQHCFFLDLEKKNKAQKRARENYKKAIHLYGEKERPISCKIPFRNALIPGYLRLSKIKNKPLVLFINGLDNLKEIENHHWGSMFLDAGYNFFTFDGPGQGEMRDHMKMIPDYENVIDPIIDYLNQYDIDLDKIATVGFSFGGYLAPRAAAFNKRISCAIGVGGLGYLDSKMSSNPIIEDAFSYVTGMKNMQEVLLKSKVDINNAPHLEKPLLFIQGGKDKVIPSPKKQADYIMHWAKGEKELLYYQDGEHCLVNYLDEILPYMIDWLNKHI